MIECIGKKYALIIGMGVSLTLNGWLLVNANITAASNKSDEVSSNTSSNREQLASLGFESDALTVEVESTKI